MFRLTTQEQRLVAVLAGLLVLGLAVKTWRARHPHPAPPVSVPSSR